VQIAPTSRARVPRANPTTRTPFEALAPAALFPIRLSQQTDACSHEIPNPPSGSLLGMELPATRRRAARNTRTSLALGVLCAAFAAGPAAAQAPPDLRGLAVNWVRGQYKSPLICEIEGQPVRGLRHVLATPSPQRTRIPMVRLAFVEMEVDKATRCFDDLGQPAPNLQGHLELRLPGRARSDSAVREFKTRLRRDRGFRFDIVSGKIRKQVVGAPELAPSVLDFSGGRARFERIQPGTDAARLLSDFDSPRKLQLTLTDRDGHTLALPLFLSELR